MSELSGGQKSLLALSFILALLKFNPAPLYILDEIDAASTVQCNFHNATDLQGGSGLLTDQTPMLVAPFQFRLENLLRRL